MQTPSDTRARRTRSKFLPSRRVPQCPAPSLLPHEAQSERATRTRASPLSASTTHACKHFARKRHTREPLSTKRDAPNGIATSLSATGVFGSRPRATTETGLCNPTGSREPWADAEGAICSASPHTQAQHAVRSQSSPKRPHRAEARDSAPASYSCAKSSMASAPHGGARTDKVAARRQRRLTPHPGEGRQHRTREPPATRARRPRHMHAYHSETHGSLVAAWLTSASTVSHWNATRKYESTRRHQALRNWFFVTAGQLTSASSRRQHNHKQQICTAAVPIESLTGVGIAETRGRWPAPSSGGAAPLVPDMAVYVSGAPAMRSSAWIAASFCRRP